LPFWAVSSTHRLKSVNACGLVLMVTVAPVQEADEPATVCKLHVVNPADTWSSKVLRLVPVLREKTVPSAAGQAIARTGVGGDVRAAFVLGAVCDGCGSDRCYGTEEHAASTLATAKPAVAHAMRMESVFPGRDR
jgi:hypothetical protein